MENGPAKLHHKQLSIHAKFIESEIKDTMVFFNLHLVGYLGGEEMCLYKKKKKQTREREPS